jgi:hypothetical protein
MQFDLSPATLALVFSSISAFWFAASRVGAAGERIGEMRVDIERIKHDLAETKLAVKEISTTVAMCREQRGEACTPPSRPGISR